MMSHDTTPRPMLVRYSAEEIGLLELAFWRHVNQEGDGCHEWTGTTHPRGYGTFAFRGRTMRAHRVAWELSNGPIPHGMSICHHCDNPPCVRVEHLFLGTHQDNMRDAARKGRMSQRSRMPVGPRTSMTFAVRRTTMSFTKQVVASNGLPLVAAMRGAIELLLTQPDEFGPELMPLAPDDPLSNREIRTVMVRPENRETLIHLSELRRVGPRLLLEPALFRWSLDRSATT